MKKNLQNRITLTVSLLVIGLLVAALASAQTKTWVGTGTGGSGTDFNTAGNWSPSGVPTSANNVVIPITSNGTFTISLSASVTINNLTFTAAGNNRVAILNVNTSTLTVNGTATIDATSGNTNTTVSIGVNGGTSAGIIDFKGAVTIGGSSSASTNGAYFIGNTNSKLIFRSNLTMGAEAGVNATNTPGTAEFDGTGTQTITWNNISNFARFNNVVIGNTNSPTVNQVSGTTQPDNILGNLTVNGNSTLDLGSSQWNRNTNTGTFLLNSTATLKLGATSSVANSGTATLISGSNFPSGFTTTLAAGSTVNYNLAAGGQTIYNTPTYGILTAGNTSGTQTAAGNLSATTVNTTAGGTLSLSTFTLALTNITNAGTISTQNTSATPISTGKTWGGTVIYAGAGQTVSQGNYAALTLSGSGTKTFGGVIAVSGLLTINTGIVASPGALTTHTANTLTLGTNGTNSGTFGSTSSAATIPNNTFFTAGTTGLITVSASSCTVPAITLGTIAAVCQTSSTFSIPYTATTGSPNVYSLSGAGITTVTNAALPASPIGANFTTTGTPPSNSFVLTVGNTVTGCVSSNVNGSVTVNASPTASAGGSQTICANATATVSGASSSNGTISWAKNGAGSITAGGTTLTPTYTPVAADAGNAVTLTMTVSNSPCVAAQATYTVNVNAQPQISSVPDATICSGSAGQLTVTTSAGTGPFTVIYNPGAVSQTGVISATPFNVTPSPGSTTAYTITSITDNNGCVRTTGFTDNTATITVNPTGTWIGTTTDWFTPSNWCGGAVPTASTDVVIPAGGTQPAIGAPGAVCNNITINASATLTMNNTGTLSVNGNWNKQGTFTGNTGSTVTFDGAAQTISGTATTFRNLTINSSTSTTISIATNIAGVLSVPAAKTLIVGAITLTINSGASASVSGTVRNSGTITTTGALTFNNGGTYDHRFTTTAGVIPTATWSAGSTCLISGYTSNTTAPTGSTQTFSNFTWNCASQTGGFSFAGALNTVNGNFNLVNTNTGTLALGTGAGNLSIGGDFSQSGGEFILSLSAARTVTITGDFTLSGGTLDMSSSTTAGNTTSITVGGNFTHSGGTLTESGNVTTTNIIFPSGTHLYTSGGTLSQSVDFTVNSGATLQMGTGASPATISSGSSGFFTLSNGGTLVITSGAGITSTGAAGNIQLTGTRTFNTGSNYSYIGSSVQNTGNGLPATVNNLTINNTAGSTGVSLSGSVAVTGTLTLTSGNLTVGSNTFTLNGPYIAGTVNNLSTAAGSSVVYNVTGAGPFTLPNFTAINNLTLNSSSQVYNLNSSPTVSGTLTLTNGLLSIGSNTLTLNGAFVRTNGTLGGSNTSNLTLAGTAGSLFFDQAGTNNVLKNFTLNNSATATLANTLNITAYDGVSSEGVLTVTGTATLTTGGFLNIKSNANGTARIAPGRTTGGYISGNVGVERYIPQNSSKGWRLLASNTSGQTINAAWQEGAVGGMVNPNPGFGTKITAGNFITTSVATAQAAGFDTLSLGVSLFKYDAAADVLAPVMATNTGNIAAEQGYFLFIRGDRSPGQYGAGGPTTATVLRSKGTLFLGNQTAVATGNSNYGLVRNPYPSRIDMRNIVRGSNLIDAYQLWDSKLGGAFGVGGFQTFTKSGSDYVVSPGGGSYGANGSVQNFIESGAAFYIQSISNTNNTAQVTEACKAASSSNNSYRPSGILSADKKIAFSLYAINTTSTDAVDGGLVFFNETYSNDVDILDVRKSGNFNENFGILRNNTDLVVERRKDVVSTDTIPFKMYQLRRISYRIDVENTGFDPAVTNIVLQDKYTGTNTQLDLSRTTSYTFTVSTVAGSFATDRFRLVLAISGNTFSGTGNWTDNARWSKGLPPAPGDVVTIAADANATLNTDFTVAGSLTMTPTSTLVVNPNKTLGVSGNADLAGQPVIFKSDATGYGSLGAVTGTLSGATNVTVERYIPNNGFRSWRLLSVPTYGNGQTIRQAWQEGTANPLPLQNNLPNYGTQITGVFSTQAAAVAAGFDNASTSAGLLSWNGTGWSNVTSTNTAIADNKAYFIFVRGERSKGVSGAVTNASATTLRTNGTVYTGSQVFNVPAGSFTLVANTYPSAINFTGLTRSNVNNLFYIWDSKKQNGNSLGVYQTFSGTNSFNCLIAGGSYTLGQPNTIIESGQAFFVTGGSVAGGGTITLLEAAKISGSNGNLGMRPAAAPAKIDSRLYNAGNEVIDANVVVFDAAYNKAVDADDAVKFGNPGANFAIETNSKILAIEGTQPVADKDVIQFRMWNLKQQDYKLEFVANNMNAQGLYAVLEDSYLKTSKEVDLTGTTAIKFTVDGNAASSAANRFRIVFSKGRPVSVDPVKPAYTIAPNPVENGMVNLLLKDQPAGKYSIKVLGTAGQVIATRVINHQGGSSNQVISLPAKTISGTYHVEITAPDNSKTSKQLLVTKIK